MLFLIFLLCSIAAATESVIRVKDPKNVTEWDGTATGCARLIAHGNHEKIIELSAYPHYMSSKTEDLSGTVFAEKTYRLTVRPGCMVNMWRHSHDFTKGNVDYDQISIMRDVEAGTYEVETLISGTVQQNDENQGLSQVDCICDVNEIIAQNKEAHRYHCEQYHTWNETTGRCEWTYDDNVCGVVTTDENLIMELRMPNWPLRKYFDVQLSDAGLDEFKKIRTVLVRNDCYATLRGDFDAQTHLIMSRMPYGTYKATGKTVSILCECMNYDNTKEKYLVDTPEQPQCIDAHKYNPQTKRCEWNGPEGACVKLTNYVGLRSYIYNNNTFSGQLELSGYTIKENFNDRVVEATVRQDCIATYWRTFGGTHAHDSEDTIIRDVEYGTYELEAKRRGTIRDHEMGLSRVSCFCNDRKDTMLNAKALNKTTVCKENHKFSMESGQCEWSGAKNICGSLKNRDGKVLELTIRNWPLMKRYDVNFKQAGINEFFNNTASATVRQRCFLTLLQGPLLNSGTVKSATYDSVDIAKTEYVERVVCDCMY